VVALAEPVPGERGVVEAITDAAGRSLDDPARAIGTAGTAWVLAPLAVALAAWAVARRAWPLLGVVVATAALVWLVNPALKRLFSRDRPGLRELVEPTSRWSFPAGHAVASAAFATLLVIVAWPTRTRWPVTIGAAVAVLLVGASRLVLGVHYPTDLVAGWALAVAVVTGLGAWLLARGRAPGPHSGP